MLDQLVESRSKGNDSKLRNGLLVMSSLAMIMILFSAVIWSIFAKDLTISGDALQLSALVTPIPVAENKPAPEPAPKRETKPEQSKVKKDLVIKRQTNTLRLDESPQKLPEKVSITNNKNKARPNAPFVFDKGRETENQGELSDNLNRNSGNPNGEGKGLIPADNTKKVEPEKVETPKPKPPPVLPKETPKEVVKPKPLPISGGVVNGKAIELPKPLYPAAAKAVGASGEVSVQITIDEDGNVISANAVSGHALLRNAAVNAARNAKFRPTLLSDQPVKVKGIIIYRFAG